MSWCSELNTRVRQNPSFYYLRLKSLTPVLVDKLTQYHEMSCINTFRKFISPIAPELVALLLLDMRIN